MKKLFQLSLSIIVILAFTFTSSEAQTGKFLKLKLDRKLNENALERNQEDLADLQAKLASIQKEKEEIEQREQEVKEQMNVMFAQLQSRQKRLLDTEGKIRQIETFIYDTIGFDIMLFGNPYGLNTQQWQINNLTDADAFSLLCYSPY